MCTVPTRVISCRAVCTTLTYESHSALGLGGGGDGEGGGGEGGGGLGGGGLGEGGGGEGDGGLGGGEGGGGGGGDGAGSEVDAVARSTGSHCGGHATGCSATANLLATLGLVLAYDVLRGSRATK